MLLRPDHKNARQIAVTLLRDRPSFCLPPVESWRGTSPTQGRSRLADPRIVALGLSLSKALAVTDSSECRHVHDCALAADRTAPSNGQWTDHLTTIAMDLVMLHWGIRIRS